MTSNSNPARWAVFSLFFFSGATSLDYEVLWTRQFELILGATTYSSGVVLAAYMGGLFLGSRMGARWTTRFSHPLALYGVLELGIGLYALLLSFSFHGVDQAFLWAETHWFLPASLFLFIRFLGSLALLIIPTTLMGATLPCLSSLQGKSEGGAFAGALYAVNTVGAVAGAVGAGYWLLPSLGQRQTALWTVLVNIFLGLSALALGFRFGEKGFLLTRKGEKRPEKIRWEAPVSAGLAVAALSGMAAMMDEVGYNRILCMVLGGSVYAFSAMLAAFLAGISAGAFAFSRSKASRPAALRRLALVLTAWAGVVVLTGYAFDKLWLVFLGLAQAIWDSNRDLDQWQKVVQFLVAFLALFPTGFLSGAVFPLVLKIHPSFGRDLGEKVSWVYSANTLGAILGSLGAAFCLIPFLGVQTTLMVAVGLNLAAVALVYFALRRRLFSRLSWAVTAVGLFLPPLAGWALPSWNTHNLAVGPFFQAISAWEDYIPCYSERLADSKLLYYREGMVTTVTVEKALDMDILVLSNNGKVEASSVGDLPTEQLAAHLPLAWREASLGRPAGRVAVIGLASGITAGSALQHSLDSLDVVELEPFMPKAAAFFKDFNFGVLSDPKFHFVSDDARHYFRVSSMKYDVIISEPSNPWLSGVSNLFTKECFEIGKKALSGDGVYCQWVQLYGMRTDDLKSLCRTFTSVFPYVYIFGVPPRSGELKPVPDLFFMGSLRELKADPAALEKIVAAPKLQGALKRIGMGQAGDLVSLLRMGPDETRVFGKDSILNTDDNGLIEFSAPLHLYDGECYASSMLAIRALQPDPEDYLENGNSKALRRVLLKVSEDLGDYWGNDFAAALKREAEGL